MGAAMQHEQIVVGGHEGRYLLDNPLDVSHAAQALAGGAVVGHGFANFYVITARADEASVEGVNLMKGRPADQVGSITVPPDRIEPLFDWSKLPAGLTRTGTMKVIDALFGMGPFGFRGPAAPGLPGHLTFEGTTQVIAPGYACPSNGFLTAAIESTGDEYLYITSANRSRHLTGADDTPAHWRVDGLRAEFAEQLHFLEHPDEEGARAAYPQYLPMSTTILGFYGEGLVLERHGSLHVDVVRETLDELGFGLTIGPKAQKRLLLREYR
jgi:hypothetical protein